MDRAAALLAAAGADAVGDEQARLALVLGVSALDTYFHMRVLRSVDSRKPLRRAVANVEMSFEDLVTLSEKLREAHVQAERRNLKAAKKKTAKKKRKSAPRPWVPMKRMLRERLLTMTFQSSRGVETALRMVGVRKPWSKLNAPLTLSTDEIKSRLGGIVHRRNQIVHEGDLQRMDRPQQVVLNPVDRAEMQASLDWLRTFVQAVDAL
tara:strand:+ start:899 stop:1522 length:624 start_codon:yes stop_codon:yes gene_type:complete